MDKVNTIMNKHYKILQRQVLIGKSFRRLKQDDDFRKKLREFMEKNTKVKSKSHTILVWDMGGFSLILKKNAILAKSLNARGYKTHFIICDGTPVACIQRGLEKKEKPEKWQKNCKKCLSAMKQVAKEYGINYSLAGKFINNREKEKFKKLSETVNIKEIIKYKYLGVRVGELAWSSTNRYFKGYLIDLKNFREKDEIIYRKYFYGALINTHIANQILHKYKPIGVLTSHGVYIDYSPPVSLAYLKGLKAISWSSGYADFLHFFTIPKSIHKFQLRGIINSEWQKRLKSPLTKKEDKRLDNFIYKRYFKTKARDIKFSSKPESASFLKRKLRIYNKNPTVCLFAHINWDACFNLSTMIFDTPNQWVIESIKNMFEIKDVNWLIRCHPAEKRGGSLFTTDDLIKKEFPCIPEHVKIIWFDSDVNTYGIYRLINAGITIFGTVGVELSLLGKPVITAGNTHYSNKGFTVETKSKKEYFSILKNVKKIKPLTEKQVRLARQYAYSYFIQRQIPLNIINKKQGHWGNIDLRKLDQLLPGNNSILDKICQSIINGKDAILDEEILNKLEDF